MLFLKIIARSFAIFSIWSIFDNDEGRIVSKRGEKILSEDNLTFFKKD